MVLGRVFFAGDNHLADDEAVKPLLVFGKPYFCLERRGNDKPPLFHPPRPVFITRAAGAMTGSVAIYSRVSNFGWPVTTPSPRHGGGGLLNMGQNEGLVGRFVGFRRVVRNPLGKCACIQMSPDCVWQFG